MARPKKGKRQHIHIDPYVYPGESPRVDRALDWFNAQMPGQRTRLCWDLIVAAVNGELGVASSSTSIRDEDDQVANAALQNLLKNMAMDED